MTYIAWECVSGGINSGIWKVYIIPDVDGKLPPNEVFICSPSYPEQYFRIDKAAIIDVEEDFEYPRFNEIAEKYPEQVKSSAQYKAENVTSNTDYPDLICRWYGSFRYNYLLDEHYKIPNRQLMLDIIHAKRKTDATIV